MESLATFGKELAQSSFARVRFQESLRAIRGHVVDQKEPQIPNLVHLSLGFMLRCLGLSITAAVIPPNMLHVKQTLLFLTSVAARDARSGGMVT